MVVLKRFDDCIKKLDDCIKEVDNCTIDVDDCDMDSNVGEGNVTGRSAFDCFFYGQIEGLVEVSSRWLCVGSVIIYNLDAYRLVRYLGNKYYNVESKVSYEFTLINIMNAKVTLSVCLLHLNVLAAERITMKFATQIAVSWILIISVVVFQWDNYSFLYCS